MYILTVMLLPLIFSYPFSAYTGGNIYIIPGKSVELTLPNVEGNDCLPIVILRVKGGEDYPRINVNGMEVVGGGIHRVAVEGNIIRIIAMANSPSTILGTSEVVCTRDPFVEVKYLPPPIFVGNISTADIILKNRGYTGATVYLQLAFNPNVAPLSPPPETVYVPPRSERIVEITMISDGVLKKPSAHPFICITYVDSLGSVKRCTLSSPSWMKERPRVVCTHTCYNASWVTFEVNEMPVGPGDPLPPGFLNLKQMHSFDIIVLKPDWGIAGENWMLDRTVVGGGFFLLSILMLLFRKP